MKMSIYICLMVAQNPEKNDGTKPWNEWWHKIMKRMVAQIMKSIVVKLFSVKEVAYQYCGTRLGSKTSFKSKS